jgi:hypothetical protein
MKVIFNFSFAEILTFGANKNPDHISGRGFIFNLYLAATTVTVTVATTE